MIEKYLQKKTGLNSRYIKDAIYSVKSLPSTGVTFGGKSNQLFRMRGKISREEYTKRRNSILISRGDKTKKGNLNLRIIYENARMKLRINTDRRHWIVTTLFIPNKYYARFEEILDGQKPYQVIIKRRENETRFDVRITVLLKPKIINRSRVMALDVNSGHVDFAVLDENLQLIQLGRINCFTLLYASTKKREHYLYKFVNRIATIAQHFDAMVIVGKLNTGRFRSRNRHANRRIKQMPQYKLRQILKYKLLLEGIPVEERSEAYTSKIGKDLAALIGVDIHKAAAIIFALKFLDYPKFMTLRSSIKDEKHLPLGVQTYNDGNGSRSTTELRVGSGLTALSETHRLGYHDTTDGGGYPVIPSSWGLSNFAESLKPNLVQKIVKIVLD